MANRHEITIGRRRFELTRPDKVLFPADEITKADLIAYYRKVAAVMVPHLRGRPLMLQRFPDGIDGEGFLQKQVADYFPAWIRRAELAKEGGTVTYAVADDEPTLAYLAAQACITPHVWLSRVDRPDRPDRVVFDLDPARPDFATVRDTARALRDLLEAVGLVPFVQTTGSRGLHVVAPLDRRGDFEAVRSFARDVAERLVAQDPANRTIASRTAKRHGRVFIDTLRNGYAQTVVAPYAVRALPGAPVATPLEWRELGDGRLHAQRHTTATVPRRLARRPDPWAGISRQARALSAARAALERIGEDDARRAG
jgi:bifunctional non-homologous end joining protein LigD